MATRNHHITAEEILSLGTGGAPPGSTSWTWKSINTPLSGLQTEINQLPKLLPGSVNINITDSTNAHFDNAIVIFGFSGHNINIRRIFGSSAILGVLQIAIFNNSTRIDIGDINCLPSPSNLPNSEIALQVSSCQDVRIISPIILENIRDNLNNQLRGTGISIHSSNVQFGSLEFIRYGSCIRVSGTSHVNFGGSISGTDNGELGALIDGSIIRAPSNITGTFSSPAITVYGGGLIFPHNGMVL